MAIFYMAVQTIRRAGGRSATAAAAYRAGTRIDDLRTGERHDYIRRRGVIACGLVAWDGTREELWNLAESAERRRNSVVAREVVLALPYELSEERRRKIVEAFAGFVAKRHGVVADWAIHAPHPGGTGLNHHAHVMLSSRRITRSGFGDKTRELDTRPESGRNIEAWRAQWAALCNDALHAEGSNARVDHRSYARQAWAGRTVPLRPQIKIGPVARRRAQRGAIPQAAGTNQIWTAINAEIRLLQQTTAELLALTLDVATDNARHRHRIDRLRD